MGFPASLKYENLCPQVPISKRLRSLGPLGRDETEVFVLEVGGATTESL